MMKLLTTLFVTTIVLLNTNANAFASSLNPPSFSSCENLNTPGDWVTASSGFHHIPGQESPIEGSDDVYYQEGGNFVQCLCAKDPAIGGIQTNWWNIGDEYDQEEVQSFVNSGWFLLNGANWNLLQTNYLAKNVEYTCHDPEPTPTPNPTSTPTPEDHSSECTNLTPSVFSGSAPLTVSFQGEGYDSKGYIDEYEFSFNDSSDGQPPVYRTKDSSASHRYEKEGSYTVKLMVKDSKGVWKGGDKCEVTINVGTTPQVLGASTTNELPKTGTPTAVLVGSLLSLASGIFIFRKYSSL